MSQPSQDGIKEKVLAVREVVPGRSNNEIVLVLTYYDYSVNDAIQAYLEDGAKAALEEWHYPGNKPNNKKKKKKQQKKAEQASKDAQQVAAASGNAGSASVSKEGDAEIKKAENGPQNGPQNGPLSQETAAQNVTEVKTQVDKVTTDVPQVNGVTKPEMQPAAVTVPETSNSRLGKAPKNSSSSDAFLAKMAEAAPPSARAPTKRPHTLETGSSRQARERTFSELSVSSVASSTTGERTAKTKPHAGLEKSTKDLQRQTLSLQRLRNILSEEVEKSFKTMSVVFEDLRLALNEREAELMFEMDKVKLQANETLQRRQTRAAELKVRTDRAQVMSDSELSELRADIKHFVSERKIDEDLTKSARFVCEADQLLKQVQGFGEISSVKHAYSPRRPSVSSVSSSVVSHDEPLTPLTPTTPVFAAPSSSSTVANHSKAPLSSTSTSAPVSRSQEVATLTDKFTSAVSLQDTPPATPSRGQKSASTSPQRPLQSASTTTTVSASDSDPRRPRNARRRQRQKLRERGQDSIESNEGSSTLTTQPSPSSELEKKQRPQQNGPRHVENRGTSPMKQPATSYSSQGKPAQGHNQEGQRSFSRRQGQAQGQRPQSQDYSARSGDDGVVVHARGPSQEAQQAQNNVGQGYGQGQGQRRQRERRPRSTYNGSENSTPPQNGPLNGSVNGTANGDVKSGGTDHQETNNNKKLQDNNKQDAASHTLIQNGDSQPEAKALPQRGPRNRGARHAYENKKSQLMVNGDQASETNGHS